jgi:hypothetical protein
MDNLSPHKTITDPGDLRGLPRVTKGTPVPRRESPLPGTKTMLCPKDDHLRETLTAHPVEPTKPPLTATVMGALAMAAALGTNLMFWLISGPGGSFHKIDQWLFFPGLVIVHLLWISSHILSNGRDRLGGLAVIVLYMGPLVLMVIDHFVR